MSDMRGLIETKLKDAFDPKQLTVRDVSEAHRGHAGFQEGGESHFEVAIQSGAFSGKSRVAQHRAIHAALGTEVLDRIHALALEVSSDA